MTKAPIRVREISIWLFMF